MIDPSKSRGKKKNKGGQRLTGYGTSVSVSKGKISGYYERTSNASERTHDRRLRTHCAQSKRSYRIKKIILKYLISDVEKELRYSKKDAKIQRDVLLIKDGGQGQI